MTQFRMYWSSRSPYVRKSMVAAHELGLQHAIQAERVVVAQARLSADVMSHNPLNKIPTLVLPDGAALFDSRVICEYLDSIADPPVLFPAGQARWEALRLQALGDGIMDLVTQRLIEMNRPEALRSDEYVTAWKRKLVAAYDFAERELATTPVPERSITPHIGFISLGCALAHIDFRFQEDAWRSGRPSLTSWYGRHARRPSMIATAYDNVY